MDKVLSPRMKIDFSKHDLSISNSNSFKLYSLKKPDTIHQNIKFIFMEGLMIIKGDYGNWLFSIQFFPKKDKKVSEHYWLEKLHMSSTQNGYVIDSKGCKKELNDIINGSLKDWGYSEKEYENIIEYCKEMLNYVNCDEDEYKRELMNNVPSGVDYELVSTLFVKKPHHWLEAIFDGWEEICNRVDEEGNVK